MRLAMDRLTQKRRGDPCGCEQCRGHLVVYSTHIRHEEGVRVRYLECSDCDWKPDNVERVALEYAPPRKAKGE